MKFGELYLNPINRPLNPAVSAEDMTDQTVETEIREYVFTDEVINGLYDVIGGIRTGSTSHNGIWVSGYFGSGKSHFMKYVDYCFSAKHGPAARQRTAEAVEKRDPLSVSGSDSRVAISDWTGVANWLNTATVDTILFNMGAVNNSNMNLNQTFVEVFWRQLNKMRGYNKFSIPLAQWVEKPLDMAGKFEAFKKGIEDAGFDWVTDANQLFVTELDMILDVAKSVLPTLSTDSIKAHIKSNDFTLSVESFMQELKQFVSTKPADYRLVFCADEISQFISGRMPLLLQLQEIVTGFHNACGSKVWLVCTAQEDLSGILDACHINQTNEAFGKIMGRFEIKVMLKGTNVDYITKKRILDKKDAVAIDLRADFKAKHAAISAQYQLPTGYESYADENSYVDTYPFVAYQFKLVGHVFNAFQNRAFVNKEVKDSARSVLNVTFRVAKETKDLEVGQFISFDQFFNTMFTGSLTYRGQKALGHADAIASAFTKDPAFAHRVVNVLFMVCNLDTVTQQTFPASVDNVTTLLVRDLNTPKLELKHEVEEVAKFLCEKNVLQVIPAKGSLPETFQFYTEDEIEVATAIKGTTVDSGSMAEELKNVIFKVAGNPSPKVSYHTGRFTVGADILGRSYLTKNAAINVSFLVDSNGESKDEIRLNNVDNSLCFFLADKWKADDQFRHAFNWFCQVQIYLKNTPASSEVRSITNKRFGEKAAEMLTAKIEPAIRKFLESCPVLSGTGELELPAAKPSDRYAAAMNLHLAHLYSHASEVDTYPTEAGPLAAKIKRPISEGEYSSINPLSSAETSVENFLKMKPDDIAVRDVVDRFAKVPYGWNEFCTLYVLNELVRRGNRDFSYHGSGTVLPAVVAEKLPKDSAHFSIRKKSAIDESVIKAFTDGWKHIFGPVSLPGAGTSPALELAAKTKEFLDGEIKKDGDALGVVGDGYPFVQPLKDEKAAFESWKAVADEETYFKTVAAASNDAATRRNKVNQVRDFVANQFAKFRDDVVDFAVKNASNAAFLSAPQQTDFAKIATAKTDAEPFSNLPNYIKIAKASKKAFDDIRTTKRAEIDSAYGACFDELEQFADAKGVAKSAFADRATTLAQKKQSDDIASLDLALNTVSAFRSAEQQKIIDAMPKAPTTGTGGETPVPSATIVQVKLHTHTTSPLKSEAEVDAYLAAFKSELMSKISAGQEVIVE